MRGLAEKVFGLVSVHGLEDQEFGRRVGLSKVRTSKLRGGTTKFRAAELLAVARLFGVTMESLVDPAQEPAPLQPLSGDESLVLHAYRWSGLPAARVADLIMEAVRRPMRGSPNVVGRSSPEEVAEAEARGDGFSAPTPAPPKARPKIRPG